MTIMNLGIRFKSYFRFNPPIDLVITWIRGPQNAIIDIVKLDELFGNRDPEYDPDKCTYKGKSDYSISKYVIEKYGKDAHEFLFNNIK